MNFYDKLYYGILVLWSKKKDEPENAPINAVMTISLMVYLNILSLSILMGGIYFPPVMDNKFMFFGLLISWGLINAYVFLRKGRKIFFQKALKDDSPENMKKMTIVGFLYVALSIAAVFILILLPLE